MVDYNFKTLETNILSRVDFFENSVNVRMDCIDDKINILNDKVDHIHDQIIQLDELHKMIDVRKSEIGDKFNRDMKFQSDRLNNKIDKLSETFTDKLNCEIDKVLKTVKYRLNCQDDKVSKSDKFSDLVQNTVASLKTEVKTTKALHGFPFRGCVSL